MSEAGAHAEIALGEARLFLSRSGDPAEFHVTVLAGPYVGPEDAGLRRVELTAPSAEEAIESGLEWIREVLGRERD